MDEIGGYTDLFVRSDRLGFDSRPSIIAGHVRTPYKMEDIKCLEFMRRKQKH